MPHRTLLVLLDGAAGRAAFEQLQQFGAVTLAIALTWGTPAAQEQVQRAVAALERDAFGRGP